MSKPEEERRLSRRELRLRAQAEAEEQADSQELAQAPATADTGAADVSTDFEPVDEIEAKVLEFEPDIADTNPDGSVRSRREMRELRAQAIDEYREQLRSEAAASAAAAVETTADETTDDEASVDEEQVDEGTVDKADPELAATQLLEAVDVDDADDEVPEHDAETADEREAGEAAADDVEGAVEDEATDEDAGPIHTGEAFGPRATHTSGYSFPDIAPLEDSGSVFDDPEARTKSGAARGDDFDDLITRAVAQEGSGRTNGTSALILPDFEHTGGLTGSLGSSGELFITGSFDLPKSIGETGSHSSVIDSIDDDEDDFIISTASVRDSGENAPVSASQAVSARSSASVVSAPAKDKNRKPRIFIITGAALIVVIGGLAAWAFTTGFFA